MLYLIFAIIIIVLGKYLYDNKLVLRFDTIFRKGFSVQKDVYGVYCFTR